VLRKAEATGLIEDVPRPTGNEADDLGTALLSLVATARAQGIDPEDALRKATTAWRDDLRAAEATSD